LFEIQLLASRESARWDTEPLTRRFRAAPDQIQMPASP